MQAHRFGRHLVVISRRTSSWLEETIYLGERDSATLQALQVAITQTGNLAKDADLFVRLMPPDTPLAKASPKVVQVPLDYPNFQQLLTKPLLIVEDIENDKKLLDFIFSNVSSRRFWTSISFEYGHAGGSRWREATRHAIFQSRIVVTLIDSDRRSPVSANKNYDKLERFAERELWPLHVFNTWPCLELENVFTFAVLDFLRTIDSSECLDHLSAMCEVDRVENVPANAQYQFFFDLKEGLSGANIDRLEDDVAANWIRSRLTRAGINPVVVVVPGLGNVVSQVFHSSLAQKQFHKVVRSEHWTEMFGELIGKMMWTFASAKKQFV